MAEVRVTSAVETSTDLGKNWSTAGVTVTGPDTDDFYTATISKTPPRGFLHLKIVH